MARRSIWDTEPELDRALMRLHDRGLSFELIAERLNEMFGTSFTRDAVKGRAERLCLPPRKGKGGTP